MSPAEPRVDVVVRAPRTTAARGLMALFFGLLCLAVVLRLPGFSNRVFNSDEAYVATQAEALLHGQRLYVDTVDRKPPVVPYLYAVVFDATNSDALLGVRVLAALAMSCTALLLAVEARRRYQWRYAAVAAGVLYLLAATALRPLDAQAANFEVFAAPITTAAMLFAMRGRTVASGVMLMFASLTLQAAAVVLVPAAWLVWRVRRARGLAWLVAAWMIPIVATALAFGVRPFVRWVFTSNGAYLGSPDGLGDTLRLGLSQTGWFLAGSCVLVVLAGFAWRRRADDIDLWLWLAVAIVPVVAGLRFFGHYYLMMLPPLTLIGVRGLTTPRLLERRWVLVGVAGLATIACAGFLGLAYAGGNTKDTRIAIAVGRYFATHTTGNERVLVWGQAPEAYWSSDRRPATRFATTGFLTGSTGGRDPARVGMQYAVPGAWSDFLADVRAHPPTLIADMSTADQRHAGRYPPRRYPAFADYLTRGRWHRVAVVDRVAILARARPRDRRRRAPRPN
jgi:hypothetical protein